LNFPDRLKRQVAFLKTNPDVACVGTAVIIENLISKSSKGSKKEIQKASDKSDKGEVKAKTNVGKREILYPCNSIELRWTLFFYCPLAHPSVLFNAKHLKSIEAPIYRESFGSKDMKEGIQSCKYCEDFELWHRMASLGFKLSNLPPPPLVLLRKRKSSISSSHNLSQKMSSVRVIRHYLSTVLNPNLEKPKYQISLDLAWGFFDPQTLDSSSKILQCFRLTQKLRDTVIDSYPTKITEEFKEAKNSIHRDCSARLGELVTISMQRFPGESATTTMWAEWMKQGNIGSMTMLKALMGLQSNVTVSKPDPT